MVKNYPQSHEALGMFVSKMADIPKGRDEHYILPKHSYRIEDRD